MNENIEPNEGAEVARRLAKQWLNEGSELIPVRHLSIDLDEPLDGWEQVLLERGVEIVDDDLGRRCVRREVLGDLLREERERLARIAAEGAARAAAHKVVLPSGVPMVEGSTPFESLAAAGGVVTPQQEFGRGGRSVFEELLDQELAKGQRKAAEERAEAEKAKDR